jgi:hypothetical protein
VADLSRVQPEGHGGVVVALPLRAEESIVWEPWLDERAVARHYGVSTRTVRRWRAAGMPSRSIGGARRYRLSECEHWHERREPA